MRPLIFLVDDDTATVRLLRHALEAEDFFVRAFSTASDVLNQGIRPHLFLLDRVLPDQDGLELCAEIRQSPLWRDVPIIFVTGRTSESETIEGLKLADDYIAKPFSPAELVARVEAVLRRTSQPDLSSRVVVGDLELDGETMNVQVRGRAVSVTTLEFRLLAYLASNLGKTFRREQLIDSVWDAKFVTPRTVDVHVRRLREKIETDPEKPCYVQTVRGRGYRFAPPLGQSPAQPRETPLPLPIPVAGRVHASRSVFAMNRAV
jgi:DNA-binding response OmpR family regulator